MKYRILIAVTMLCSVSCTMKTVTFQDAENLVQVYEIPETKEPIFTKASAWVSGLVNNPESSIQHSDAFEGVIIAKYLIAGERDVKNHGTADSRVFSVIDIRIKDNKARIEIKPQHEWQYDPSGMSTYKFGKVHATLEMKRLAESFHQALLKKSVEF